MSDNPSKARRIKSSTPRIQKLEGSVPENLYGYKLEVPSKKASIFGSAIDRSSWFASLGKVLQMMW
ncbi:MULTISPECIES: hypothetical protein [unclassified Microcoleus]|uniref:hypothetical protein n=1 Tax=unclassified Microcoleus TaxID=2642155 RepID=UPI002FD10F3F